MYFIMMTSSTKHQPVSPIKQGVVQWNIKIPSIVEEKILHHAEI